MIRSIGVLYSLLLLICPFLLHSQTHTQEADTSTNHKIDLHEKGLIAILEQQKEDSIKRKALEDQFLALQLHEKKEKENLLREISLLKSQDSILYQRKKQKIDSLRTLNHGVPVAPFRDTIFVIYNQLGSYSKQERAKIITSRIQSLADNNSFDIDSLKLSEGEEHWIIFWQDQMIVSINDQDAMWADTSIEDLSKSYLHTIRESISKYRDETSVQKILTGFLYATLIVTAVILIIYCIRQLIHWIKSKIIKSKDRYLKGIKVGDATLVTPQRQRKFIWSLLNLLQWILFFTSIYLALPFILNQFPGTEGYADTLLNYFLSPIKKISLSIITYLPNLATILVISILFRYVLKALKYVSREIETGDLTFTGFYKEWAKPTYEIIRTLLLLFWLIVIFPYFPGSDSPVFKGVSVFLGVLVTFSSAGVLGNIVSGLMITYMRSFALGDRIKIGEVTGDIVEKSLLATKIRTTKNEIISIPNAQVMNSHTINYSADIEEYPLIIHTEITLAYEIPWQQAHELLIKACHEVTFFEIDPAPFVLQTGLNDFYVTYQINAYTKHPHKQALIYSELRKHIMDVFHQAGIELLSPHFTAVRDGSQIDIPHQHKKPTHEANPIKISFEQKNKTD